MKTRLLFLASLILLLLAAAVHLNMFLGQGSGPDWLSWLLTAGMVLVWLVSSRTFKELHRRAPDEHPLHLVRRLSAPWLLVLTAFLGIYAFVNLGMMIRTHWPGSSLRGISGFWMFFFALGVLMARAELAFGAREGSEP